MLDSVLLVGFRKCAGFKVGVGFRVRIGFSESRRGPHLWFIVGDAAFGCACVRCRRKF